MFKQQMKILEINDLSKFTKESLYEHYMNVRTKHRDFFVSRKQYGRGSYFVRIIEDAYYSIIGQRNFKFSKYSNGNSGSKNSRTLDDDLAKEAKKLERIYPQMKINLANGKFDAFEIYINRVKELKGKGYNIKFS